MKRDIALILMYFKSFINALYSIHYNKRTINGLMVWLLCLTSTRRKKLTIESQKICSMSWLDEYVSSSFVQIIEFVCDRNFIKLVIQLVDVMLWELCFTRTTSETEVFLDKWDTCRPCCRPFVPLNIYCVSLVRILFQQKNFLPSYTVDMKQIPGTLG